MTFVPGKVRGHAGVRANQFVLESAQGAVANG